MHVLVIGLRKQQFIELCKLFPKVSLSGLCDQDRHRGASGIYDHVISITKFTNHSTENNFSRHKGFIRIANGGGYSSVKNTLNTLVNGELAHG